MHGQLDAAGTETLRTALEALSSRTVDGVRVPWRVAQAHGLVELRRGRPWPPAACADTRGGPSGREVVPSGVPARGRTGSPATAADGGSPAAAHRPAPALTPGPERALAGCDVPTPVHVHLVHWADGGATDLQNLALLCPRHHRAWHRGRIGHRDLRLPGEPPARAPAPAW